MAASSLLALIDDIATILGERGLTRVLIEGGGRIVQAFLEGDLVDQVAWFRAPAIIGGDGLPAVGDLHASTLAAIPAFTGVISLAFGTDSLDMLVRKGP